MTLKSWPLAQPGAEIGGGVLVDDVCADGLVDGKGHAQLIGGVGHTDVAMAKRSSAAIKRPRPRRSPNRVALRPARLG